MRWDGAAIGHDSNQTLQELFFNFLFMFYVFINRLLLITLSKQINCHSLIWSHTTQRFHSIVSKGQYYLTCWHANSKLLSKKCNEKMQSYCQSQGWSGCFGSSSSSHGVKARIQQSPRVSSGLRQKWSSGFQGMCAFASMGWHHMSKLAWEVYFCLGIHRPETGTMSAGKP